MCVFVSPRLARTRGRHHAERIIYLLTLKCRSWLFGFVVRSAMCETKRLLIILSGRVKCVCLFSTSPAVAYLLSNYLAAQHEHQNSNKFFHSFFSPYCPIILQTDTSNRKVTNSARPAHKPKAKHQTYQSNQMEVKRWSNERINSRRFLRFLNFVWCWNFGIGLNAEQFMDIVFVLFGLFTFFSFYFWCYFEIMKKMVLQHIPQQIKILFVSS